MNLKLVSAGQDFPTRDLTSDLAGTDGPISLKVRNADLFRITEDLPLNSKSFQ